MKNISIYIPAYNAAQHIGNVIQRIPDQLWTNIKYVYIVNDGSTDNSIDVIQKLSDNNSKIQAINFNHNKGYGAAVKKGLDLCKSDGCEYAVCLHADEQYPPELIPEMLQIMENQNIELIQGSRISSGTALSGGMPLYKFIAGICLVKLENLVFRMKLTDYHSGFLIFSRKSLNSIPFEKLSRSFDFDLETIATARALKLKISEYPIPTRYANEVSYLNPIGYGLRVLRVLIKYITGAYKS